MNSLKIKIGLSILTIGFLSACGSQPVVDVPASTPTEKPAPFTQTATNPAPATDTVTPTEEPTTVPVVSTGISFSNDVYPIIKSRCINCHGGQKVEEGLVLKTYSDLMAGSDNGPVIMPGDAANSLLIELITTLEMPKKGPKLTPPQIQLITDWVNQGALDN